MALKRLRAQEMIQISSPWVTTDDPANAAIARYPLLAALLPRLETAQRAIFELQTGSEDPKSKSLSQAEAELDATHDGLVRGIHESLTALAQFSATGEELLRLRHLLLPDGLEHTRKTYRGEAGHAAMVQSRLDETLRARLKSVTLHDQSLLDLVESWLDSAQKLGAMEEERARLAAPAATAAEVNAARLAWIRVVNALVANAELAEVDEATDHLLFSALRAAARTADSRRRAHREAPAPVTKTGASPGSAS